MNNTPRTLNRLYLLLLGLVLTASGAALLAHHLVPAVREKWQHIVQLLLERNRVAYLGDFLLPAGWMWYLVLLLLVVSAVAAVLLLRWQTGGRLSHFAKLAPAGPVATGGAITVHTKVAEQLLKEHLEDDTRVLNVSVNTHRVGKLRALKAKVEMARGAELSAVTAACQHAAAQFAAATGSDIPLVFEIKNGMRSAFTSVKRVL